MTKPQSRLASLLIYCLLAWSCFATDCHAIACQICERAVWNANDRIWDCIPDQPGTLCNDGNTCMSQEHCECTRLCVGTLSCVPRVPGAISSVLSSSTGSYGPSWGGSSGVVDTYALYENDAEVHNGTAVALSTNIAGRSDGT